ncbi:hypothetical protein BD324DRAFT_475166 [Kockovaella imperatae]|uniref:Chromo domain-containing protein n=1 Tax=Kockovaella imperatae TaxID=4999 RepID=A0A1Y1UFW2_9TREE|nr:hypothetical protein BD324DRAFT_475166 [Kockovaella imperatae]ORX36869.1 hypothetical protein BD324DRAFT_475166 [Kockovaella imperatae]
MSSLNSASFLPQRLHIASVATEKGQDHASNGVELCDGCLLKPSQFAARSNYKIAEMASPSTRRGSSAQVDESTSDPAAEGPSSQEFEALGILDEKGPAGYEGRYLVDWAPANDGEPFSPSWERKTGCSEKLVDDWLARKAKDPSIVGRHGGEAEEDYERRKNRQDKGKGKTLKRVRSKGGISAQGSEGTEGKDSPQQKRRPTSRVKHGWDYVPIPSQEQAPIRTSIESEIRRRKKEGLPPLQYEVNVDGETGRATRKRSRDVSGSTSTPRPRQPRPSGAGSTGVASSANKNPSSSESKSTSGNGGPRQVANNSSPISRKHPSKPPASRSDVLTAKTPQDAGREETSGPSHLPKDVSGNSKEAKEVPAKSKSRISFASDTPSTSKAAQKVPTKSTSTSALRDQSESLLEASKAMTAKSPNRRIPATAQSPKTSRMGPVPNITGSQFKAMVKTVANGEEPASITRDSPATSQIDAIVHFSSPVEAANRSSQIQPVSSAPPASSTIRRNANSAIPASPAGSLSRKTAIKSTPGRPKPRSANMIAKTPMKPGPSTASGEESSHTSSGDEVPEGTRRIGPNGEVNFVANTDEELPSLDWTPPRSQVTAQKPKDAVTIEKTADPTATSSTTSAKTPAISSTTSAMAVENPTTSVAEQSKAPEAEVNANANASEADAVEKDLPQIRPFRRRSHQQRPDPARLLPRLRHHLVLPQTPIRLILSLSSPNFKSSKG